MAFGIPRGRERACHGSFGTPISTQTADVLGALTPEQIFDAIGIRVDGPRAWDETLAIGVTLSDTGESYRLGLRNGVLVHRQAPVDGADVVVRATRTTLPGLLTGATGGIELEGDVAALGRLMAVLDSPDPEFAIVTP